MHDPVCHLVLLSDKGTIKGTARTHATPRRRVYNRVYLAAMAMDATPQLCFHLSRAPRPVRVIHSRDCRRGCRPTDPTGQEHRARSGREGSSVAISSQKTPVVLMRRPACLLFCTTVPRTPMRRVSRCDQSSRHGRPCARENETYLGTQCRRCSLLNRHDI